MDQNYIRETPNINTIENVIHSANLNSSEIGNLWNTFMSYSMISLINRYFYENTEDSNVKSVLEMAQEIFDTRVSKSLEILRNENLPAPVGFSHEDIDIKAPRLFSDIFYLYYLKFMNRFALPQISIHLTTSYRDDIREFYHLCSDSGGRLFEKVTQTMLAKGILIRPPYITINPQIDMVKRQNFLTGFLGEKRPLLAQEISYAYYAVISNFIGKCLLMGFRQTARLKQVRDYMDEGIDLAQKIIDSHSALLEEEDIPVPMIWDSMVTESTVPPFSDKLMMYHTLTITRVGIGEYGLLGSTCMRHDILANLLKFMPQVINFSEDGINIMIDNGWFEEPPRVLDRDNLSNMQKH